MNAEHTLIVHPLDINQENVLRSFFETFKIRFEVTKEKPYNQDFVDMVLQAESSIKQGKGKKISSEEFDKLWK